MDKYQHYFSNKKTFKHHTINKQHSF